MPKTFNWKDFISHHTLFGSFKGPEIEQLLQDEISEEQEYAPGETILQEGDSDDSFFLIGEGTVEVVLQGEGDHKSFLSFLRKGDFFGEFTLVGPKTRSATVLAKDACTVLAIKGPEFLRLVNEHPELGYQILITLSERLRHTSEQAMTAKLKSMHEKLHLFDSKISAHLQSIDAYWQAVDNAIDQTNKRMDDMAKNAAEERVRKRWRVGIICTIISLLIPAAVFLEYNPLNYSKKQTRSVHEARAKAYYADENYKRAFNAFRQALDILPNDTNYEKSIAKYLAYIHQDSCNFEAAKKYWRIHLESDPYDGLALYNAGVSHHMSRKQNYDEALAYYDGAIRNLAEGDPTIESSYFNKAAVYSLKNRKEQNPVNRNNVINNLIKSVKLGKEERRKLILKILEHNKKSDGCKDVPYDFDNLGSKQEYRVWLQEQR